VPTREELREAIFFQPIIDQSTALNRVEALLKPVRIVVSNPLFTQSGV